MFVEYDIKNFSDIRKNQITFFNSLISEILYSKILNCHELSGRRAQSC